MAHNLENSFGDESLRPDIHNPTDEAVHGAPPESSPKSEPPLPPVDAPESRPMVPQASNQSYQAPYVEPLQPARRPEPEPPEQRTFRRRINWRGLLFWILIGCFSVFACAYILKTRQQLDLETRDLTFKSARVKSRLSCTDGWQELGFILRPGDQVIISSEGEYLNSKGGRMNGDGLVEGGAEHQRSRSYDPLFPHGCIIARTSGKPSEVFHIGSGGILGNEKGGRLQVRVNDLDVAGNRGILKLSARTFLAPAPEGIEVRGSRDSGVTPILR